MSLEQTTAAEYRSAVRRGKNLPTAVMKPDFENNFYRTIDVIH
jgi:hypothetical protein